MAQQDLPRHAQVVIIGGGIIGTSVAYHLTKLGWSDVILLEQGQLSCGTTWHAAGLVGQLRSHANMTRLIRYSTKLYAELEGETGLATGWKNCGSLAVAFASGSRAHTALAALLEFPATAQCRASSCNSPASALNSEWLP